MTDILNKKLSEVTVEELLTHLGLDADLVRQQRERSREVSARTEALFADVQNLKALSSGPERLSDASEVMEWAVRHRDHFAYDYPAGHLLVVYAWVQN